MILILILNLINILILILILFLILILLIFLIYLNAARLFLNKNAGREATDFTCQRMGRISRPSSGPFTLYELLYKI